MEELKHAARFDVDGATRRLVGCTDSHSKVRLHAPIIYCLSSIQSELNAHSYKYSVPRNFWPLV